MRLLTLLLFFFLSFAGYSQTESILTIEPSAEEFLKEWGMTFEKNSEETEVSLFVEQNHKTELMTSFDERIYVTYGNNNELSVVMIQDSSKKDLVRIISSPSYGLAPPKEGLVVIKEAVEYSYKVRGHCTTWKIRKHSIKKYSCKWNVMSGSYIQYVLPLFFCYTAHNLFTSYTHVQERLSDTAQQWGFTLPR